MSDVAVQGLEDFSLRVRLPDSAGFAGCSDLLVAFLEH